MKRALIASAVLALAFAVSAFAADVNQPTNAPAPTFEQQQANLLKQLDARIASLQEAKGCIQAAKSHADVQICRQKHRAEMQQMRGEMRPQRGMGGPMGPRGGQGGPMGPGGPIGQ
jgi:hypothetical protein